MSKKILFDAKAREKVRDGVLKMARAVKSTLGPLGRTAILDKGWGSPNITKEGVTVAEEIDLADPFENLGAQMLKQACTKSSDDTGDGTTTTAVLAEAIVVEGLRHVTAGVNPIALQRGIRKGAEAAVEEIRKIARPVEGKDRKTVQRIATIAANGDESVGEMIATAMEKVGADGVITIEEGKGIKTELKVVEGMQFDRGFLSPHFVNKPESVQCRLEKPLILVHEDKISSVSVLIPLLEKVAALKRPLLVIAEEVEGEVLATLVVNKLRGILEVCAVKAPGYGDRRRAMLEDIAGLTGAKAVLKDLGIDLKTAGPEILGSAKTVIIDSDNTTIVEGAGDKDRKSTRLNSSHLKLSRMPSSA